MPAIAAATVATRPEKWAVDITVGRHRLVADEPVAGGGQGEGPTPYGYLLSGLGACTAITLRMYAERKGWDIGPLRLHLEYLAEESEHGGGHIERRIAFGPGVTKEHRDRLLEIAEKTPVTRTIKAGMDIMTTTQA
jgi:putative redox protein